jgi:hypothetical protein
MLLVKSGALRWVWKWFIDAFEYINYPANILAWFYLILTIYIIGRIVEWPQNLTFGAARD